ncbi:MerR family transcriptional regulator [Candidatus Roizmanbacteria bacterium]|nr:MerR family transcriptional regulator [Candidatus Roizmanbacteria bacterium]
MITIDQLHQLKNKLDAYRPFPLSIVENMDEWYKVELTYTSNAIEGNTLSRAETARVVEKGITVEGKTIVEHLEAVNHAKAWDYICTLRSKTRKEITKEDILGLHTLILQNIDTTNAGRYRTVPVRIAGSTVVLPNPLKVPNLMNDFINWLNTTDENDVDFALKAHFKFVSIHPFTDGNGRTGRLLMNLILMQGGYPPAIVKKEDRKKYIDSIEKGQLTNDLSDYISFMYENVQSSLKTYLHSVAPQKDIVADKPRKLLKIGELAKITEESVPTVRFWTQKGLLQVKEYSTGGYQLYHPDMVKKVQLIRKLQKEKRLTIVELKKVIAT